MHKVEITTRDGVTHFFKTKFAYGGNLFCSIDMTHAPEGVDFSPENIQSIEVEGFTYKGVDEK